MQSALWQSAVDNYKTDIQKAWNFLCFLFFVLNWGIEFLTKIC